MRATRSGPHKFYKGKYFIVFYDKTDERLMYMFDNIREILKFQKKPITRENVNKINVELYRALKSVEHFCTFLIKGEALRVYMIDATEEEYENERHAVVVE